MLFIENLGWSEADLLAELHHRCRVVGLVLRMEVCIPSAVHKSKRMRVDAALISSGHVLALIEGKTPGEKTAENTRQRRAYAAIASEHRVPTFWLNAYDQIDPLVEKLQGIFRRHAVGPVEAVGSVDSVPRQRVGIFLGSKRGSEFEIGSSPSITSPETG